MLTFAGQHVRTTITGSSFRAAPSAGGGGMAPAWMNSTGLVVDFSVIAWVKPTWGSAGQYSFVGMNKFFVMKSMASGPVHGLECKIAGVNGDLATFGGNQAVNYLGAIPAGAMVLNEWNLVGMVWDSVAKTVRAFVLNSATVLAGVAQAASTAVSGAYSVAVPDLATMGANAGPDDFRLGGGQPQADWIGSIGTVMIANMKVSAADMLAIYNSRQYLAPWRYIVDTYGTANYVAMNTSIPAGLVDEAGASLSQWLIPGNTMASGAAIAAWPYLDSGRSRPLDHQTHRPQWTNATASQVTTFASHELDTFFTPQAVSGAATPGGVAGQCSALKNLSGTVAANDFTIAASNSRGVRRPSAGGQTVPERHSEGYIAAKKSIVKGILNGRPWVSSTEAVKAFALAIAASASVQFSGTLKILQDSTSTGWTDFSRAWTGGDGATSTTLSQGQGVALTTGGATYGVKFTPESGSLFLSTNAIRTRYHFLAFPGHCGSVLYRRTASASQAAGTDIDVSDTTLSGLNTARTTYTYTAAGSDSYNSGTKTLVVMADLVSAGVKVGDLVVNGSLVSAAEIATISVAAGVTTMTLTSVLGQTPLNTHVLHFGPWSVQTVTSDFPVVSGGLNNRGLLVSAPPVIAAGTLGPILLAHDAWATTDTAGAAVVGHVIGHAGYSGNGYANQLTDCWTGAIANFYAKMFDRNYPGNVAASYNLLLHHADQQVASPGITAYRDAAKAAVPALGVAYCGDPVYAVEADVINWDTFVLGSGNLAISITGDSRFGTLNEQIARGYRVDAAHPSALGHQRIAEANLQYAASLATGLSRGGGGGLAMAGHAMAAALSEFLDDELGV